MSIPKSATAFQIGAFQFNAFQEGSLFEIDGGRYPRHRRPIFIPYRDLREKEEDRTPISAVAHSTAGAAFARAQLRLTLRVAAVKAWALPAYTVAKVVHDPFPITCVALSKNTAQARAQTVLTVKAASMSMRKATVTHGEIVHDPALHDFSEIADLLSAIREEVEEEV